MSDAPQFRAAIHALFEPLGLAALGTWGLIVFEQTSGLLGRGDTRLWPVLVVLLLFLLAFVARGAFESRSAQRLCIIGQLLAALADVSLVQSGAGPILGVVAVAQLPFLFRFGTAVAIVLLSLVCYAAIFASLWDTSRPYFTALMFGGFQFFALLTARLAATAELQRDQLAEVNAHLLATRNLLEAGARDGERLRLSRELHDVAGHSLTALKLNLELALRLPEAERGSKITAARELADALLDDIRAVVGQLRRYDGVDLGPALRALTERLPGPSIELELQPDLRVAEVAQAEALLRCAQEALTNALRHSGARRVRISLRGENDEVRIEIADDGHGESDLVPGNGLTGMRERFEEAGGRFEIETAPGRGFCIRAALPQAAA